MKSYRLILLLTILPALPAMAQDRIPVKTANTKAVPVTPAAWYATKKMSPLSYNYYNSLGAACKAELKLEKATSIPFRFRLGSLAQTDYMEQKPHAAKPEQR